MNAEDKFCIQAYQNGDADALSLLVKKYKNQLYVFILRMGERREDADDIFQEVWFRAIKNIHRFKDGNFLNWIFRIAHNLVIDRARRASRSISMQTVLDSGSNDMHSLEDHLPAPGINPSTEASGVGLGRRIEEAIEEVLLPNQKQVFQLRMHDNASFKEIANIQKCSINTCLSRMQYALGKLRLILKDEFEELKKSSS